MRYRLSSLFLCATASLLERALLEGSTVRPVNRWYSSTASTTTTGRPCFSTTTGSARASSIS